MSADNFLVIRKNEKGFVILHGSASVEQWPTIPENYEARGGKYLPTLETAVIFANEKMRTSEYPIEYGMSIHPECYPDADAIKDRQNKAARAIAKLTLQYLDGKLLFEEMESQIRLVLMEVDSLN